MKAVALSCIIWPIKYHLTPPTFYGWQTHTNNWVQLSLSDLCHVVLDFILNLFRDGEDSSSVGQDKANQHRRKIVRDHSVLDEYIGKRVDNYNLVILL